MILIKGILNANTLRGRPTLYCPNYNMIMKYNVSCPGI